MEQSRNNQTNELIHDFFDMIVVVDCFVFSYIHVIFDYCSFNNEAPAERIQ